MWDHNILLTSYTAMKPKSCRYLHSGLHRQKYGADISRPDEIFGLFYLGDMHNTYLALLKKLSQMCVKKLRGSNSCFPSHSLFQPPTKGGLVVQAVQEEAKGGGARWEERGGVGPAETRLKVSRRLQLKLHQNSSGFSLPRKDVSMACSTPDILGNNAVPPPLLQLLLPPRRLFLLLLHRPHLRVVIWAWVAVQISPDDYMDCSLE